MPKEIQLTQGQVAIVDDWRFEELNQHKWCAVWNSVMQKYYATRRQRSSLGKQESILMHVVVNRTPKGMMTDHRNGDTLYNCEENLRVCTNSQNQMNRGKSTNNTSGYKGVSIHRDAWQALIHIDGKTIHLKYWPTAEQAARAYDDAAERLFGEFAVLNFPRLDKT